MQAVLLGPPGSGKGTQAAEISTRLGFYHLATGDVLREEVKNKTPLGLQAQSYMNKGELVPDELIVSMVSTRIEVGKNYLWDGFPRTEKQAVGLEAMLAARKQAVDLAILLEVPDEIIVRRISGRLLCPACGTNYHRESKPPKKEKVCDQCGGVLEMRADDLPKIVEKRLSVYRKQTEPLFSYYEKRGILIRVNGDRSPEAVTNELVLFLKKAGSGQNILNG